MSLVSALARRRDRSRQPHPRHVVALAHLRGRWPGANPPLTDLDKPDAIQLIPHLAPTTLSTQADLELQALQQIEELHANGALDRYTADVVDAYVDSRIAADIELIDGNAASARATNGGLLLSNELGNLTRATEHLRYLREADNILGAAIAGHREQLLGDRSHHLERIGPLAALQLRPVTPAPDLALIRPSAPLNRTVLDCTPFEDGSAVLGPAPAPDERTRHPG